jgi:hypothetical protein
VLRLNLFTLADTAVAGVCKYDSLFTVQQSVSLLHVVLVISSARYSINQASLSDCTNVRYRTEMSQVVFLGLVHLWLKLTRAVFGEDRNCNQSDSNDSTRF